MSATPGLLEARWLAACRLHELASRFPLPEHEPQLVNAVFGRVLGEPGPFPDPILQGLGSGFASAHWLTRGEVCQMQLSLLVEEAARLPGARPVDAIHTLAVLGRGATDTLITAWRGEAQNDALTGLENRRAADLFILAQTAVDAPFLYGAVDLDGLKSINDGLGHDAGDDALRRCAAHIQGEVRALSGIAYRYGGDEFAIVVPNASDVTAIEDLLASADQSAPEDIRFSWGVAAWPADDPDPSTVVRLADQRMYVLKRARKSSPG